MRKERGEGRGEESRCCFGNTQLNDKAQVVDISVGEAIAELGRKCMRCFYEWKEEYRASVLLF